MSGLRVVERGPLLLVEDLGRPGWAHLGVPGSGALDPAALRLANRLVGNPEAAAGLEILLGGCSFVAERSLRFAVTGASVPVTVDGRAVPWGEPVSVRAGETIALGRMERGLRCWLAVGGAIAVAAVLGSRSTDTLSGLGPRPVESGDLLPLGEVEAAPTTDVAAVPGPTVTGAVSLRLRLGPRHEWFSSEALALLGRAEYVVGAATDRVALRLEHPAGTALDRRVSVELPSEGLVTGAVQVPTNGQPLIFLADHPVTGGYPVVGVIEPADLASCAQARPGDRVRLRPV